MNEVDRISENEIMFEELGKVVARRRKLDEAVFRFISGKDF